MEDLVRNDIVKASIKNERCEVKYKENNSEKNVANTVSKECNAIVHSDMKAAFDRLKLHLIKVCEQPEACLINLDNIHEIDMEQFENYTVTGYSIGGSDENQGVTIIGQKLLKTGMVLNLIAPFVKFEDEDAYSLAGELNSDIQGCNYEVEQYLFNEKWGIKQAEIDFDTPADADVDITFSDAAGKKGKKVNLKHFAEMAEDLSMTGTE